MIPDFDYEGNLPPGVHSATLIEIEERFSYNLTRKEHLSHLKLLIKDLIAIGCKTIYIDGSFVTRKSLPNDMDICWENRGVDLNNAKRCLPILWELNFPREKQQKKYHADIFPASCIERSSTLLFLDFFQKDKTGNVKGIIKLEGTSKYQIVNK
jgi:hypothetical protein